MSQLNDFVQTNLAAVVAVLGAVYLLALLIILVQALRLRRVNRRIDSLTRGADGRSLESVFAAHLDTVLSVARDLDTVRGRTTAIEGALPGHLQRFGLVRFNPFEDTGGNQSFALALLDGNANGLVVSSLHSRTGTRVYAKEVRAGKAEPALSAEETQAVERAQSRSGVAVRVPAPARPQVSAAPARFTPAPDPTNGGRRVGSAEPSLDAGFLERRLRGEDEEPQIWGDRTRS